MGNPITSKTKSDMELRKKMVNAYMQNVEDASGLNNNCAFHAFILGLSQQKILDGIENNFIHKHININIALQDFLEPVAKALNLKNNTWLEVKAALIHLRATNPKELQIKTGPVLRRLSSSLLRNKATTYGADNQLRTQSALVSEFIDAIQTNSNISVRGDIYKRIDFIAAKFKAIEQLPYIDLLETIEGNNPGATPPNFYYEKFEKFAKDNFYDIEIRKGIQETNILFQSLAHEIAHLSADKVKTAEKNKRLAELKLELQKIERDLNEQLRVIALLEWWRNEGNNLFLDKMADEASAQHAGNLELAPLADLVGLNLWVRTLGSVSEIHSHNGEFPLHKLSADEQQLMLSRNILRDGNKLLKRTPDEVRNLLNAIPDYDTVMAYIKTHKVVNGTPVPASWSPETIQQLKARDLVKLREGVYQFVTKLDAHYVEERVNEMPRAKEILQDWVENYHEAPTVLLQNLHAVHWNHVPVVSTELPIISDETLLDAEIVRLANEAVGEILDVLENNSVSLSKNNFITSNIFHNTFTLFSDGIQNYSEKEKVKGFFATKSQEIMKEIEQAVVANGGVFKPK